MSNKQLFRQVEGLLERKLTPEEHTFLTLASETLKLPRKPPQQASKPAKIA